MAERPALLRTIPDVRQAVRAARQEAKRVALVPTMGYLHDGHLALVARAKEEADFVVVSIFVNPLQFGPSEDFASYPRDLDRDLGLLREQGLADAVFAPSVEEMYPQPIRTQVSLPTLSDRLCGRSRPGHFTGVATVVSKLFHIVQPDVACFGQKDGQQLAIIQRMVADLNLPIRIVGVPTVREPDGLAKSSRNVYLTPEEREHAVVLYRTLSWAKERILAGERRADVIRQGMRERIEADPVARLDYADLVSMPDLESIERIEGDIMLAVAAYFGKARLIDNFQMHVQP
ncbi:pantoate--beta-alanine ligase [Alicyclobacillus vulcanalis]|uniref:Pantothenate synthetase n=1 Tax=Alicyclobacillus vulcanalis TaxID=252246 RepID=A0A1N7JLI8_9BACL|nr:pantoate--beta-alanine ligase [Alicyclobacillus vulcanalis]SIS50170.1 pantothenate synthetase [Alicyclobacillus vulcanalis]